MSRGEQFHLEALLFQRLPLSTHRLIRLVGCRIKVGGKLKTLIKSRVTTSAPSAYAFVYMNNSIAVPAGSWDIGYSVDAIVTMGGSTYLSYYTTLSTSH